MSAIQDISPAHQPRRAIGWQFVRYLCVGGFNTLFGYCTFALTLTLLNRALPQRFLYLTVVLASVISTPLNITVAYFGYKFFVFRTKGNHLREWLRAFAVYGTSMLIGLAALSALTRFLQGELHQHADLVQTMLLTAAHHLQGGPLGLVQHVATSDALAGYLAGAIVTAVSVVYSYIGHRKFTFRAPRV